MAVPFRQVSDDVLHVSTPLHGLPSSQSAFLVQPQALVLLTQPPASSVQLSAVHAMPSSQFRAEPPHAPAVHTSVTVHALPSLQPVPFVFGGFEQTPLAGLQDPALWHWSGSGHTTGVAPTQLPAWHVSPVVQRSPSLQVVPLVLIGFEHMPALHVPGLWH